MKYKCGQDRIKWTDFPNYLEIIKKSRAEENCKVYSDRYEVLVYGGKIVMMERFKKCFNICKKKWFLSLVKYKINYVTMGWTTWLAQKKVNRGFSK